MPLTKRKKNCNQRTIQKSQRTRTNQVTTSSQYHVQIRAQDPVVLLWVPLGLPQVIHHHHHHYHHHHHSHHHHPKLQLFSFEGNTISDTDTMTSTPALFGAQLKTQEAFLPTYSLRYHTNPKHQRRKNNCGIMLFYLYGLFNYWHDCWLSFCLFFNI